MSDFAGGSSAPKSELLHLKQNPSERPFLSSQEINNLTIPVEGLALSNQKHTWNSRNLSVEAGCLTLAGLLVTGGGPTSIAVLPVTDSLSLSVKVASDQQFLRTA